MANVGTAAGIFKKYEIEIEITSLAGGAKLHAAMIAGRLDIALGAGTDIGLIVKGATEKGVGVLGDQAVEHGASGQHAKQRQDHRRPQRQENRGDSVGALTYWLAQQMMEA